MQLLLLFTIVVPAIVSATFVNLNKQGATLRKHYHTILKYTTLHRFSRGVNQRIKQASGRSDAVGQLAQVMLQLHNPHVHPHRTQLAYSSFYALARAMRGKQFRAEADAIWATTLESIKQAATCKHCPPAIDRYLQAYRAGKASVYGSWFGRGRLARKILDNPKACFLKRPEMRHILREMELQFVQLYLKHVPHSLAYHLADPYEVEAQVMAAALATPVDDKETVGVQQQVQQENLATSNESSKWRQWLSNLKARVKSKIGSIKWRFHRPHWSFHRHHHDGQSCGCGNVGGAGSSTVVNDTATTVTVDSQPTDTQLTETQQQQQQQQADTQQQQADDAAVQPGDDESNRLQFVQFLQNIRDQLAAAATAHADTSEYVVANTDTTANTGTNTNNAVEGQPVLQGAVVEEQHQVISQ